MICLLQGPCLILLEWPPPQTHKTAANDKIADSFMLPIGDRQLGRAGVHNRGTWNGSVTAEVIANTGMQSAFNSARLAACDASHLLPYGDNRVQNSISLKS
jgi:hypothetical protein